jgi:prepilin peptidase CpaA
MNLSTLSTLQLLYVAWLALAAGWDFLRMRIPNLLTGSLMLLFLVQGALDPFGTDWLSHLAAGLGMLVVVLPLFAFGWIGGGDAKLLAAVALWAGLQHLPLVLIVTALTGSVLMLLLISLRPLLWAVVSRFLGERALPYLPRCMEPGTGIPYGVAIALGGAAILLPS